MKSQYALVYTYGTFDDCLFLDSADVELTAEQEAQLAFDETLPALTPAALREVALQFREAHGAGIVGIKIVDDIDAFAVIFEGPLYQTHTVGNTTTYPPYDEEVIRMQNACPALFGNFRRWAVANIQPNGYGGNWLE